jgi:hypothetical protein
VRIWALIRRTWSGGTAEVENRGPQPLALRVAPVFVLIGVALRFAQWLGNPSLWLDELQLVSNILDRDVMALMLDGLDHGQVAPVGFLALVRTATVIFGDSEPALRLVPLMASVLSLVLFWRLARGVLDPAATLVVTAGFALNPMLISLAGVAKQYATDVLATVFILVALRYLWDLRRPLRQRVLMGAAAGTVGLLSIPAIITAAAALAALLIHTLSARRLRSYASAAQVLPLAAWAAVAGGSALWAHALMSAEMTAFMHDYWARASAFAPPLTAHPTWLLDRWLDWMLPGFLVQPYIGMPGPLGAVLASLLSSAAARMVLPAAAILAAVVLVKRCGAAWATAVLLPFAISFVLARLELYPLEVRTSAYLVPLLMLLAGTLMAALLRMVPPRTSRLGQAIPLAAVLVFAAVVADRPPVYAVQHDREIIRELELRRQPGEPVVAHPLAMTALAYYGPPQGVTDAIWLTADAHTLRGELESHGAFRDGATFWVLFTHARNRNMLLCMLDEAGIEQERVVLVGGLPTTPVSVHRYVIDAARWATAEGRPTVTAADFGGAAPRCRRQ